MSQFVFCLVFLFAATHFSMADQVQLQVDGKSGLRWAVLLESGSRPSYGNFAVDKFQRLQVSVGSSIKVTNAGDCALRCVNNPPCSSFNIASSPSESDGNFQCELLNADKYRNPEQLVKSENYHHFSIKVCINSFG